MRPPFKPDQIERMQTDEVRWGDTHRFTLVQAARAAAPPILPPTVIVTEEQQLVQVNDAARVWALRMSAGVTNPFPLIPPASVAPFDRIEVTYRVISGVGSSKFEDTFIDTVYFTDIANPVTAGVNVGRIIPVWPAESIQILASFTGTFNRQPLAAATWIVRVSASAAPYNRQRLDA